MGRLDELLQKGRPLTDQGEQSLSLPLPAAPHQRCTTCGAVWDNRWSKCGMCGRAQPEPREEELECPICGTGCAPEATKCPGCGAEFKEEEEPEEPQEPSEVRPTPDLGPEKGGVPNTAAPPLAPPPPSPREETVLRQGPPPPVPLPSGGLESYVPPLPAAPSRGPPAPDAPAPAAPPRPQAPSSEGAQKRPEAPQPLAPPAPPPSKDGKSRQAPAAPKAPAKTLEELVGPVDPIEVTFGRDTVQFMYSVQTGEARWSAAGKSYFARYNPKDGSFYGAKGDRLNDTWQAMLIAAAGKSALKYYEKACAYVEERAQGLGEREQGIEALEESLNGRALELEQREGKLEARVPAAQPPLYQSAETAALGFVNYTQRDSKWLEVILKGNAPEVATGWSNYSLIAGFWAKQSGAKNAETIDASAKRFVVAVDLGDDKALPRIDMAARLVAECAYSATNDNSNVLRGVAMPAWQLLNAYARDDVAVFDRAISRMATAYKMKPEEMSKAVRTGLDILFPSATKGVSAA